MLHALEETPLGKVLSEASLGKAYLKQMGVRPFREVQPDFPDHLTGLIMSSVLDAVLATSIPKGAYKEARSLYSQFIAHGDLVFEVVADRGDRRLGHSQDRSRSHWRIPPASSYVDPGHGGADGEGQENL
jgi:hypothetical protein